VRVGLQEVRPTEGLTGDLVPFSEFREAAKNVLEQSKAESDRRSEKFQAANARRRAGCLKPLFCPYTVNEAQCQQHFGEIHAEQI
jgi:hypothetical protein